MWLIAWLVRWLVAQPTKRNVKLAAQTLRPDAEERNFHIRWAEMFLPHQISHAGSGTHPACCPMGTAGSFPEVK